MTLYAKLLHPNAKAPERKSEKAAGYDFYAPTAGRVGRGKMLIYPLGVAVKIKPGCCGKLMGRSSLEAQGLKALGWAITNGVLIELAGLIDEDYVGELKVVFKNLGAADVDWDRGDRVCQMVVSRYEADPVQVMTELPATDRGEGGFGSTGR